MINFMKYRFLYFFISALVIVPGIFSLVAWGLKPGIDFIGGTELELQVGNQENQGISTDLLNQSMASASAGLQFTIDEEKQNTFLIKSQPMEQEKKNAILTAIKEKFPSTKELRYETVGPVLGRELLVKTLTALILAAVGITFYIAYRFRSLKYGISAVLAMLHDSMVVIGSFSLLGHFIGIEVDTLFVTALLTILSFSVHDTIVVYDRIREIAKKNSSTPYHDIVNKAVTETLSRSINNSMTIIFALLALWLLGGETIRWFVFALLIGTITGTYSSTFTAAPILVVWTQLAARKNKRKI